ncbi:MAG: phosphoenolpyruvate-utilizing N-terminal domain-containing protein, partial [Clostridia bacterium]|nr:phosphoenolpyruvate-utilizing N-terminal domain-containing protein [Clostridia bacterium]
MNRGIGVSQGYGVGRVVIINNDIPSYESVQVTDTEKEKERLKKALELFTEKTTAMAEKMRNS